MISERIDGMLQKGWIEEVKKLCENGFKKN